MMRRPLQLAVALVFALVILACSQAKQEPSTQVHSTLNPELVDEASQSSQGSSLLTNVGYGKGQQPILSSSVSPYQANSLYTSNLGACALAQTEAALCQFSELPMLGGEYESLDVERIMGRVLVSQRWMGERFKQVLLMLPNEVLQMFKPVTSIVISDDISPSYFSSATAAIYLDPQYLWVNLDEKNSIFQDLIALGLEPSSSDKHLNFRSWWRYSSHGELVPMTFNLLDNSERSFQEMLIPVASLLIHELAHANDFFPASEISLLEQAQNPRAASLALVGERPSDILYQYYPLVEPILFDLAELLYGHSRNAQGGSSSTFDYDAQEVGGWFETEAANDDYAYVSQYEDMAMLAEEALMKKYFNLDRDVAYLQLPQEGQSDSCDFYLVAWGMRSRIAASAVAIRAELVLQHLLPDQNWSSFLASLPQAQLLEPGSAWCTKNPGQ